MAESLDISGISAIFISSLKMRHEKTKSLKSNCKAEDFWNPDPHVLQIHSFDKSESEFSNLWDVPSG